MKFMQILVASQGGTSSFDLVHRVVAPPLQIFSVHDVFAVVNYFIALLLI